MTSDSYSNLPQVVTIDGFAGVGKSTVARELARKLGFVHLNSGAIYRAVALLAIRSGIPFEEENLILAEVSKAQFDFLHEESGGTTLVLNGETPDLLLPEVAAGASKVAVHRGVREFANRLQREAAARYPLVLEGRDTGTVVFPQARWKFFLEASARVRAQRRYDQLKNKEGQRSRGKTGEVNENELRELILEIEERDLRDRTRKEAPTVRAEDAVLIDTSDISAAEVVNRMLQIMNEQPVE
jgi:cytidylate kinase